MRSALRWVRLQAFTSRVRCTKGKGDEMANERVLLSSERNDWRTPPELFEAIQVRWNIEFDLDAACSAENKLCEHGYTIEEDSLSQDWAGRVWCNPPYGRGLGKWIEKAYEESRKPHCRSVHMLINARTDTKWWHSYVTKASMVVFLKGRVKFLHGDSGEPMNSSTAPSCIVVFDSESRDYHTMFYHWDWREHGVEYMRQRKANLDRWRRFLSGVG